jgi:hypothetical protein
MMPILGPGDHGCWTGAVRTSENAVPAKFIRQAHSLSPHGPGPPEITLDHK